MPPGPHKVRIDLADANHEVFPGQSKTVTFAVAGRCFTGTEVAPRQVLPRISARQAKDQRRVNMKNYLVTLASPLSCPSPSSAKKRRRIILENGTVQTGEQLAAAHNGSEEDRVHAMLLSDDPRIWAASSDRAQIPFSLSWPDSRFALCSPIPKQQNENMSKATYKKETTELVVIDPYADCLRSFPNCL